MVSPHLLRIDASYSTRSYAGVLEGLPAANTMISSAKEQAEELWGKRATLVMDPPIKNKRVPTWTHMIWASGPALNDEDHGTELVIIWWSEFEPDTKRVLDAIDWEKNAKGFQI